MKKNEIGGACGTYGGEQKSVQDFGGERTERENTLEDLDRRDHSIIVSYKEIGKEGMDWIDLAQKSDTWLAVIYMVMGIVVP